MSGSDTSGLFDPEAFEQIPGQISMERVEPSFTGWQPPCESAYCARLECCAGRTDCPCGMADEPEARS